MAAIWTVGTAGAVLLDESNFRTGLCGTAGGVLILTLAVLGGRGCGCGCVAVVGDDPKKALDRAFEDFFAKDLARVENESERGGGASLRFEVFNDDEGGSDVVTTADATDAARVRVRAVARARPGLAGGVASADEGRRVCKSESSDGSEGRWISLVEVASRDGRIFNASVSSSSSSSPSERDVVFSTEIESL